MFVAFCAATTEKKETLGGREELKSHCWKVVASLMAESSPPALLVLLQRFTWCRHKQGENPSDQEREQSRRQKVEMMMDLDTRCCSHLHHRLFQTLASQSSQVSHLLHLALIMWFISRFLSFLPPSRHLRWFSAEETGWMWEKWWIWPVYLIHRRKAAGTEMIKTSLTMFVTFNESPGTESLILLMARNRWIKACCDALPNDPTSSDKLQLLTSDVSHRCSWTSQLCMTSSS